MDPRIRWEDILMRIEVPNRSAVSDRYLQNSTNNLINRQENRLYLMLAWHTTGAQGMRANTNRTMVLRRVADAQPPLPPNSTRGLTPGLINPALGNVPGNVVPQPVVGADHGRLRVGMGRPRGAAANQAPAIPPQVVQPQAPAPQNSHGRDNQGRDGRRNGSRVDNKRHRTSQGRRSRPSKRRAGIPSDSSEATDDSERSESSTVQIEA